MNKFIELITEELKIIYPNAEINVTELQKNGITECGIILRLENESITPIIKLEPYHNMYIAGMSKKELLKRIIEDYNNYKEGAEKMSSILDNIADFKNVKKCIYVRLINTQLNKYYLKDKPSIQFMDLSAICWLQFDKPSESSVSITNSMINSWGIEKEELFRIAMENTNRIKEFISLTDIIQLNEFPEISNFLYVLTNIYQKFGNAYIMKKECLEEIGSKLESNFFILPSSTHEVIISPGEKNMFAELKNMVKDVNSTEVLPEDFLSNNVYWYDYKNGILSMC